MLYRMTIMTSLAARRTSVHLRVSRAGHASPAPAPVVRLHLLDGGAPGGQLAGAARHAIEAHGTLTSAQRLSLTAPSDLPRLYTQAAADTLVEALLAAGAHVVVIPDSNA